MRLPKSRWAIVGLSLVVIATVAGITLGVTTLLAVTLANEYDLDEAAEMDYSRVTTVREIAEYVHGLIAPGGER